MGVIVSILAWIAGSSLGQYVLKYELGKITDWLKSILEKKAVMDSAHKKNVEVANASVAPLQKAVTGDEIDKSSDNALDNF